MKLSTFTRRPLLIVGVDGQIGDSAGDGHAVIAQYKYVVSESDINLCRLVSDYSTKAGAMKTHCHKPSGSQLSLPYHSFPSNT